MSQITFLDVFVNVIVPLIVGGVFSWLLSHPKAPFDPEYKGALRWVILVIVVCWILFWFLRVVGVVGGGRAMRPVPNRADASGVLDERALVETRAPALDGAVLVRAPGAAMARRLNGLLPHRPQPSLDL